MANKSRRTIISVAVLAFLILSTPSQSHAIEFLETVTKERAKVLGLEVRSTAAGPDAVRVELEFETKGELKNYLRVALEIYDGNKQLLSSTLREEPSKPGRVLVSFTADRTQLDKLTLRVVALDNTSTRIGHMIPVKEFVDLAKAH